MTEIKVPKYREVQLEFTASQAHSDLNIYLPYYSYRKERCCVSLVRKGNYILTDQFGRQWQCDEGYFKDAMEEVKE